jgi:tRNA U34 5-carboxymethylaminomethyl modifying enzyme MnmG/GidA
MAAEKEKAKSYKNVSIGISCTWLRDETMDMQKLKNITESKKTRAENERRAEVRMRLKFAAYSGA